MSASDDDFTPEAELRQLARFDLNLLPPLLALLEEQSVTRAAERLGTAQSTMSHTLDRCRTIMGDPLLEKWGRGLRVTARGARLRAPLAAILAEISEGVLETRSFDPARDERLFTIAASTTSSLVVLPRLIESMTDAAPLVRLKVVDGLGPRERMVDRPDVDLALVPDHLGLGQPRERLYTDEWVIVVDDTSALARQPIGLAELAAAEHITFEADDVTVQPYDALRQVGVAPKVRLSITDFVIIPLLLSGSGRVAIVQKRVAELLRTTAGLAVHPLPIASRPLGIDMIWNPRFHDRSAREWLSQLLKEIVQ